MDDILLDPNVAQAAPNRTPGLNLYQYICLFLSPYIYLICLSFCIIFSSLYPLRLLKLLLIQLLVYSSLVSLSLSL